MDGQWQRLLEIFNLLGDLLKPLVVFLGQWLLLIAWLAWWLWAVDWRKVWPVLAQGAWLPAVLLMLLASLVWAEMAPSDCDCLGFVTVPNFWWQLGDVSLLVAVTLFCGWLQGVFGWAPAEVELEPQPEAAGHGHHHH